MSDENDTSEKKKAIDYLDNALKHKDDFLKKTMSGFNDNVTKEELCTRIRGDYFKSYLLRMAIAGKKLLDQPQSHPVNAGPQ